MMGYWTRFVDNVSSKLAFFPPFPPTYKITGDSKADQCKIESPCQNLNRLNRHVSIQIIKTPALKGGGGGQSIVTAWIPYSGSSSHRPTILYSHPNAVDLGQVLPLYLEISRLLQVNVFAYDYSGYGNSTGEPSVQNSLADVTAAFDYLCATHNKRPQDIILYGQSVGSGPTVYLGAKQPDLAGIILHAPLLSGMRVLYPGLSCWPRFVDIYPNAYYMKLVKAPALIMHGTKDEVIDIRHGRQLFKLARNAYEFPLWAEGYGHQNLEACPDFVPRLKQFVKHIFPQ